MIHSDNENMNHRIAKLVNIPFFINCITALHVASSIVVMVVVILYCTNTHSFE